MAETLGPGKESTGSCYTTPGVVCIYAIPGHGKTVAIRKIIVESVLKKIKIDVLDPLYVLRQVYPGAVPGQITFYDSLTDYWPVYCKLAQEVNNRTKQGLQPSPRLVAADEIAFLISESPVCRKAARMIVKTCRNFGITFVCSDQRTADTPRSITACARVRLWGKLTEPLDLKYAEFYGINPNTLKNLPQFSFLTQICY